MSFIIFSSCIAVVVGLFLLLLDPMLLMVVGRSPSSSLYSSQQEEDDGESQVQRLRLVRAPNTNHLQQSQSTAAAAFDDEDFSTSKRPNYFNFQWVDHYSSVDGGTYKNRVWSQKFFTLSSHYRGPGSPIFLILGGEGTVNGMGYPFIVDHLAPIFGAFVIRPEHRFYGSSQPITREEIIHARTVDDQPDPRTLLLTSEQALHDAMRLLRFVRDKLGCSLDKFSRRHCPVISVGGSYPGFLSALSRLMFPATVDMAYAASAPMKFYSQSVDQASYYYHISNVTETAFPGCTGAVQKTLNDVTSYYYEEKKHHFSQSYTMIGICDSTLPPYIQDTPTFINEVVMMAGYSFANANMGFYPPSEERRLGEACRIFQGNNNQTQHSLEKLSKFFALMLGGSSSGGGGGECFNMTTQVPAGPSGTISAGDWSGVGTGTNGESWDFQTCSLLVEQIGFGTGRAFDPNDNTTTMFFPGRNWTMEWMTDHCRQRFNVTPQPLELVHKWRWDDLINAAGASNILFSNGLNDGWSVSGIQRNLSESVIAINFPNGSHHSDLSYAYPGDEHATPDLIEGRKRIQVALATWLAELPGGQYSKRLPS